MDELAETTISSEETAQTTSAVLPLRPTRANRRASFYDLTYDELRVWLEQHDIPAYRATQLYEWAYRHLVTRHDDIGVAPRELRGFLEEQLPLDVLQPVREIHTDRSEE